MSTAAKSVKDRTLVLHIGLHNAAASYLQHVLSVRRYDLLREGVLYPMTGAVDRVSFSSPEGAQSGHASLARAGDRRTLVSELLDEIPDTVSTLLVSSEDFTLPKADAGECLRRFSAFGSVQIVLVLRRQDAWIESYYKHVVDQYRTSETRSFDEFLRQMGPKLLDFHTRFSPWRDLVGPESFHVLSYDDLESAAAVCRRVLEIAGVRGPILDDPESIPAPRSETARAIDTLGMRILNAYRLEDRDERATMARAIYAAAPEGDFELMTPEMRDGIQARCAPINERIEAEWFGEPVPGFRFGAPLDGSAESLPSGLEVVDYVDRVISLCEGARKATGQIGSAE